jgi:hypothetical protein
MGEPLTLPVIEEYIQRIKDAVDDPEMAHGLEDDLFEMFIATVAVDKRTPDFLRVWAQVVLTAKDIDFPRWCA